MFRIANRKKSQLVELEAKLLVVRWVDAPSGPTRQFLPLRLERNRVAFFPLTWTIVHPIDSESPLLGMTYADLKRGDVEFLVLLSATDETFAGVVHARSSYRCDEIVWGAKFRSVFNRVGEDGVVSVNLKEIHDYEPVALPS
jgi:inward rectifier potassium channel